LGCAVLRGNTGANHGQGERERASFLVAGGGGRQGVRLGLATFRDSFQFGLTSAPMIPHFVHTLRGVAHFTLRSAYQD
jgi:hypothetical protein